MTIITLTLVLTFLKHIKHPQKNMLNFKFYPIQYKSKKEK